MTKLISILKEISVKLNGGVTAETSATSDIEQLATPDGDSAGDETASTEQSATPDNALQHDLSRTPNTEALATLHNAPQKDREDKPLSPRLLLAQYLLLAQCLPLERYPALEALTRLSTAAREVPQTLIKPFISGEKPLYKHPWFWLGLGVGGGAIAINGALSNFERSLPNPGDVLTFVRRGTLTIKASNGTILQQVGDATHQNLKIDQIPQPQIQAFIASEDRRFYQHNGVDYQGILRAFASNLQAGNVVEGGSTLTQQLARIVFLDQKRSFWRKFKEARLAQKIEQKLNKQQILERYLNLVYLGSGAYGVADASWVYFSKPVTQLNLPEMATLAGMTPAPSEYSPFVNKQACLQRRNLVLQDMQQAGYITPSQAKNAIAAPLITNRSAPKRLDRKAPYFTDYIQKELPKYVSPEVLEKGGLIVETSLKSQWQQAAEEAVKKTIEENGRSSHFEQAALVAIDPRDGQIRAMVGGKDFYKNQFNRVTQAQRQPGSTFKAFVYTAAIAAGFTPYRGYYDAPLTVEGYKPKNFSEKHQGWLSMRDALIQSNNTIAVRVLMDAGWQPIIDIAQKMGIESELKPIYSLALGGSEVNLLELTNAYGTFATNGLHAKAHGIRRILDPQGKVIYKAEVKSERALDPDTSTIMNWMLRGVVNEGTGRAARLDRPVAGKTGTSDEARDLLFVGYIPQMVAGVWLGNDNNDPTWGASSTAASTWREFMVKVVKDIPVQKFPERPEKLEGRKPQIKVQPIEPKSMFVGRIQSDESSREERGNYRPRRYRYRNDSDRAESPREQRPYRRRRRVEPQSDNTNSYEQPRYRRRRRVEPQSDNTNSYEQPRYRRRRVEPQSDNANSYEQPRYRRRRYREQSQSQEEYRPRYRRRQRRIEQSTNE